MVLKQIDLTNFRQHRKTSLEFSEKLNYFVGGNGQGKTSILEAIYYLCTTKNLNQASESDVVTFGENNFEISGKFIEHTKDIVTISYDKLRSKKTYYLNNKLIGSATSIFGKFPIVVLTQADHALTLGSPSDRRRFVDMVISQASQTYLKILIDYNKTLRQRANVLLQIRDAKKNNLIEQLDVWTESLINLGTQIIEHRKSFEKEFNQYLKKSYNFLLKETELPVIVYQTFVKNDADIKENFKQLLKVERDNEIKRAINLVGPHRDEFVFKVNNLELKRFGSQGQHKTFQIALRFGEFFYLKEKLSKTPIFIMDDVFGELDAYRASKISDYITQIGQAFITMTDLTNMNSLSKENTTIFNVEQGKVTYV
ncbi:DNA replication/repair protein RecF [Melioribacteraceae bacterium 4301-Me]|uniref:DNA replication/repair protein RecF n=1 Tax=Pyranulibacter aquaticus TaxID=3163344 RepID=UPI00359872CA